MESSFRHVLEPTRKFRQQQPWNTDDRQFVNPTLSDTGQQMKQDFCTNPSWPKVRDLWNQDNYNSKIKTGYQQGNSNDMSIQPRRELKEVSVEKPIGQKKYQINSKYVNNDYKQNQYDDFVRNGQFGKQVKRSQSEGNLGRKKIDRGTTELRGSIGMGFDTKDTYKETSIENMMSRKMNVEDPRHGFELRRNGDKNYRQVEQHPDFQKMEGLISGSTGFAMTRMSQRRGGQLTTMREQSTSNLILRPNMNEHQNKLDYSFIKEEQAEKRRKHEAMMREQYMTDAERQALVNPEEEQANEFYKSTSSEVRETPAKKEAYLNTLTKIMKAQKSDEVEDKEAKEQDELEAWFDENVNKEKREEEERLRLEEEERLRQEEEDAKDPKKKKK